MNSPRIYNTPLEIGMRVLLILSKETSFPFNKERLLYLDFLSLNSGDIDGPESLHAPIPNRGVQIFAKHSIIGEGIKLLLSKDLISVDFTDYGYSYSINDNGKAFLNYFTSRYFKELSRRVDWTARQFGSMKNTDLERFINSNIQKWGGQFLSLEKGHTQ